ncbi:glycosyltransferase [uncultured Amphritea sp.]|uniref:glycosyltransferase n=1 Tax=uncultured Amphritea sp. TaxID=981605 RepID=UPI00262A8B6E|nr:glycosyltransferase [uncultured Amphritea sp.]
MNYIIIIPCLNEQPYIANLIDYLIADLNISVTDSEPLLVMVDGGSSDGTQEIIKSYAQKYASVIYLQNPAKLQSCAINLAVKTYADNAEYLIRLDVHADYPSGYVSTLLLEALENHADSVVVTMDTQAKTPMQAVIAAAQNSVLGNGGSGHRNNLAEGRWIDHGHHALINVKAYKQVGGYDESFSHNEDAELDYRLRQAGFNIWLTGKTNIVYYPRATLPALFKQYKGYGRGRAKNIIKHKVVPKLRQCIPMSIFPLFLLFILGTFCWPIAVPFSTWLILSLVVGILIGHKSLSEYGSIRYLVGLAAATMHFAWSLGFVLGVYDYLFSKFVKQGKNNGR